MASNGTLRSLYCILHSQIFVSSLVLIFLNSQKSEWNAQEDINHSAEAVEAMHYFSNFFGKLLEINCPLLVTNFFFSVNAARQNDHKFSSFAEEYKSLIYNYAPVYSYTRDPDF